MGKYDKEYGAFEIFEQIQNQESREEAAPPPFSQGRGLLSFEEAPYYEIEYETGPVQDGGITPAQGSFSLSGGWAGRGEGKEAEPEAWAFSEAGERKGKEASAETRDLAGEGKEAEPETWAPPGRQLLKAESTGLREEDPARELFNQMRDIAREGRYLNFRSSRFYNQRMQQENARLFYLQGMFMKDFEDEYGGTVPFSSYYPSYQMMGYGQLRTFFTWRTAVRQGRVEHVFLSYAFLYIYELLNNIGVASPDEGMERFLFFWDAFRVYDRSLDKYVVRWLKDYYIYYGLPGAFRDFVEENGLGAYYPELSEENSFELYCSLSKYDIRKSVFFAGREDLVRRCFLFTLERVQEAFAEGGFGLEGFLFQPTKKMAAWVPFRGALFYPAGRQADRRVMLSRKEIYVCCGNQWTFSTVVTADSGKRLMGYIFKQMEAVLREQTKYRHKISANTDILSPVMADELKKAGISLELVIMDGVKAFYKEETKTVVRVNPGALERIRQEAYVIQEKLAVPEEGGPAAGRVGAVAETAHAVYGELPEADGIPGGINPVDGQDGIREGETIQVLDAGIAVPGDGDGWKALKEALTGTELQALRIILDGKPDLKQYANEQGTMLEVLAEGINEKASDIVGDGVLDNAFEVYGDYLEDVRRMLDAP